MRAHINQSSRAESFEPVATKSRVRKSWPSYSSWFPYPKETYIAGLSAACILLSLTLRYIVHWRSGWEIPLYISVVAGGVPLVIDLGRKLLVREFGSDLLAGLSVITSVFLDEYLVGAIIVLMLSGGAALEHYATRRASAVLEALAKRMPTNAHRKATSGITDIALADIVIGERLVVLPNEICPVDGVVVSGRGTMDESYLTGEPFQISKVPGSEVLSGAINGEAAITIAASALAADSRYAKIMQVMRTSEQNRTHLRRVADRIGAWYTLVAVAIAIGAGSGAWMQIGFLLCW